ncbi:Bax inhibitor-1/YccA family protein [Holzapfeliella sp. He02]|uniref:Bax inhibitor-1/YccA family protein n=1 Tax=Holzapfeliella saturejae TaxID=3082953 RepID=A0ABU8SI03_9LACO
MDHIISREQTKPNNTRQLLNKTFQKVALAVLITAVTAFAGNYAFAGIFAKFSRSLTGAIVVMVLMFALITQVQRSIQNRQDKRGTKLFYGLAALNGLFLSYIFSYFSLGTIGASFLVTSGLFLALSRFGLTREKDLISWQKGLFITLIGVIILSVFSLFIGISGLSLILNIAILVLFSFYTIFDTNQLVKRYETIAHRDIEGVSSLFALTLYMDFINIYLSILQLLGNND